MNTYKSGHNKREEKNTPSKEPTKLSLKNEVTKNETNNGIV
jgi:hypothetical protein